MSTEGKKILYLGSDNAYFKALLSEFHRLYPGVVLEQQSDNGPEHIQAMLIHVTHLSPALIFIDFSKNTDNYMHLSRLLVRTNHPSNLILVGLHDYLSPAEQHQESFLCGVNVNYIKSGEVFDVVYGAMNLVTPGQAKEHGFATAKLDKELEVRHLCKIGYVSSKGIHIESLIDYAANEDLIVRHPWLNRKKIPSPLMKVKKKSIEQRFYHSSCALDLDFAWIDPLITSEGDSEVRINELNGERDYAINKARKFLEAWLKDNQERSFKKSVRVMVIDRELSFYQSAQRTDKFNHAIRCQPYLKDPVDELQTLSPHMIAIVLDSLTGTDGPQPPLNDMAFVQKLTQILTKKLTKLNPYIIVFNAGPVTSQELQNSMGYPQLIAMDGSLTTDVVLKMATMVENKLKLGVPDDTKDLELRVYLKKSNPVSITEIDDVINLVQISECDMVFTCKRQLKEGASFRLENPFKGHITVVNHPQLGKPPAYYALINCIGELEKKSLRRFVNSVFFKDHDAAKLSELENFQNLNQAKWQDMLNKQKAKLEEEEKLKAEQEEEFKRAQERKESSAAAQPEADVKDSKENKAT
jgi:hypothetical protein